MKKKFIIVFLLLSLMLIFNACESKEIDTNDAEKNIQSAPTMFSEITTEEIKQYLNLKKSVILKIVGDDNDMGTTSIMESYMVFPCIFVEKLGLTFIFPNDNEDLSPSYISINSETNVKDINIKGAKPGMSFKDIMSKLGNGQVKKTWFSNEANVAYELDFNVDGVIYSFVSYDEQGIGSELYISLSDN